MEWIDSHNPQPISPEECERIATELENKSYSRETDYAAHALRQAGRQLQSMSTPPQCSDCNVLMELVWCCPVVTCDNYAHALRVKK